MFLWRGLLAPPLFALRHGFDRVRYRDREHIREDIEHLLPCPHLQPTIPKDVTILPSEPSFPMASRRSRIASPAELASFFPPHSQIDFCYSQFGPDC